MSVVKHFIDETVKRVEIDEFLRSELERAGYGGVDITQTPMGAHMVVYAMRPGLVIGRGGETIKNLARALEEKFHMANPQISVAEIEIPELNAHIVASRVASALNRGIHFRRAAFWALNRVMESGALGAEIVISGKLRTDRARFEKFNAGYLPKSGNPALKYVRKATLHVQLKPGMLGVKVHIMPPDVEFPDKISILESVPAEGEIVEKVKAEELVEEKEEIVKAEVEEQKEPEEAAKKEAEVKEAEVTKKEETKPAEKKSKKAKAAKKTKETKKTKTKKGAED
jgi:small subunit ribosomal protein S3